MPAAQLYVVHYTGHRMSGADTHTALLPAAEAKVYEAICALLDTLNIAAAYGSLSSGADTLFAEALLARGAPLHLYFPFALDQFKVLSVLPSGANWGARFDRIVANSGSVSVLASADDPEHGYAACAQAAMEAARAAAGRLHARPLQIACWDGKPSDRQAGTAADVAAWRAAGLATRLVKPQ